MLIDSGRRRALEANIAFGVAATAIVGAGVLWFTGGAEADSAKRVSLVPRLTHHEAGLAVRGSF
jgi:hypothetical protein